MPTTSWTLWTLLLLLVCPHLVQSIWFPWYFHRYGLEPHSQRHKGPPTDGAAGGGGGSAPGGGGGEGTAAPSADGKPTVCPPGYQMKNGSVTVNLCDDNPVLMQLARLYVVSPERIVLLLAQPSLTDSCTEIRDVLSHISSSTQKCRMSPDNIYAKLSQGLDYFKTEVCDGGGANTRKRCTQLGEAHSCIRELRTDMIECEAPADWYEKTDKAKVCQSFNDVLNCYYTRAAMLCGLDAARELRSLAGDCMGRAILHNCPVNKQLPAVAEPMPSNSIRLTTGAYGRFVLYSALAKCLRF